MFRLPLLAIAAAHLLSGCDPAPPLIRPDQAQLLAGELEKTLGLKPDVDVNQQNGELASVRLTFPGLPGNTDLIYLSSEAKRAVLAEFNRTPRQIVISFVVTP